MKSVKTGLIALAVATTGFFAFKTIAGASIKGSITPAENAVVVRAIYARAVSGDPVSNRAQASISLELRTFHVPNRLMSVSMAAEPFSDRVPPNTLRAMTIGLRERSARLLSEEISGFSTKTKR